MIASVSLPLSMRAVERANLDNEHKKLGKTLKSLTLVSIPFFYLNLSVNASCIHLLYIEGTLGEMERFLFSMSGVKSVPILHQDLNISDTSSTSILYRLH